MFTQGKWEAKLYKSGQWGVRQAPDAPSVALDNEILSCGFSICNIVEQSPEETEANARLIAAAPDRHQQMLALTVYDWEVDKVSLYDEEGIEGWTWTEPNGTEHTEMGDWDELPPWPDSAREAIAKAQ